MSIDSPIVGDVQPSVVMRSMRSPSSVEQVTKMPDIIAEVVVGGWFELVVLRIWDDAAESNARPLKQILDKSMPVDRCVDVELVEVIVVRLDVFLVRRTVVAPVFSIDALPAARFAGARVIFDELRRLEAVRVSRCTGNDREASDPPNRLFVARELFGWSRAVSGTSRAR